MKCMGKGFNSHNPELVFTAATGKTKYREWVKLSCCSFIFIHTMAILNKPHPVYAQGLHHSFSALKLDRLRKSLGFQLAKAELLDNAAAATTSSAAPVDSPKHTFSKGFKSSHQGWVTSRRLGKELGCENSLYPEDEGVGPRHYLGSLFRAVQKSWSRRFFEISLGACCLPPE